MRFIPLSFLFLFFYGHSQNIYMVYFKEKNNIFFNINNPKNYLSDKAIARRKNQNIAINITDIPVNSAYIDTLKMKGAKVWYTSKWLNAAYIKCDTTIANKSILGLNFVAKVQKIFTNSPSGLRIEKTKKVKLVENITVSASQYGNSLLQLSSICIDEMHSKGFYGKGITIAITDGGFSNANAIIFTDSLFVNNQIKGTYDFVRNESFVYDYSSHGTDVLSLLAANVPGKMIGAAPKADYYLFRTENGSNENIVEEANWLIAAEKADSLGVDILNVSLGYSTFDNPLDNHTYKDMDGNTTIITKAADLAANKGMIVVVSMGNSGNSSWKYLSAPADADSVLTVGAVNSAGEVAGFSGYGPAYSGKIKPEVVAQGTQNVIANADNTLKNGSGTSYAAPIVAGMAAGLWQANSTLTNMEIIQAITKSGNNYQSPNNRIGYGIPCFGRAQKIIQGTAVLVSAFSDRLYIYPNPIFETDLKINIPTEDIGQMLDFELYNTQGKLVFAYKITNASILNTINLTDAGLESGFYIAKIKVGFFTKLLKITKR